MRLSNKIVLASLNRGKYEEFKELLAEFPEIDLLPAQEIIRNPSGLKHAEKYSTYLENSVAKARLTNLASHYPALADDSGLEVDALGGKPGVFSHRYAPPVPGKSQDQANVAHLLDQVKSTENLKAKFVCTLALVIEGIMIHSTGVMEGTLIREPRGE
ncbi:MAG: non-canonical purine NTP pyrophosphatase, partial [Bdellovibrio sp.]|nr:non-canonical purine NTP pyrophosphatase [Bdellovibrio sp.]